MTRDAGTERRGGAAGPAGRGGRRRRVIGPWLPATVGTLLVVGAAVAIALALAPGARRTAAPGAGGTPASPTAEATNPAPAPSKPATTAADPYRGLGGWIDIYDGKAWRDGAAAVADLDAHGVDVVFVETGNSGSPDDVKQPAALGAMIDEAHARGMTIVAWYLPELRDEKRDLDRSLAAIAVRSPRGGTFDSFALDIESGAVKPVAERNARLLRLSRALRDAVGERYALGAIIPSPVGLSRERGYWKPFPYTEIAGIYDVVLPMAYYTYHGEGEAAVYTDTVDNLRILRAQPDCAQVPVHMIGGLAEKSSPAEVRAFVRACREKGCIGAGLYDWATTAPALWPELQPLVKPPSDPF